MLMYGVYSAETLEKLIDTVHHIHNTTLPLHMKNICRTTKLVNTQITLCKHTRFTPLFYKFTTLFKNSAG